MFWVTRLLSQCFGFEPQFRDFSYPRQFQQRGRSPYICFAHGRVISHLFCINPTTYHSIGWSENCFYLGTICHVLYSIRLLEVWRYHFIFLKSAISSCFALLSLAPSVAVSVLSSCRWPPQLTPGGKWRSFVSDGPGYTGCVKKVTDVWMSLGH